MAEDVPVRGIGPGAADHRRPGQKAAGKATGRLAELVDIYPTLADLCGLSRAATLRGEPETAPGQSERPGSRRLHAGAVPGYSVRTVRLALGSLTSGTTANRGPALRPRCRPTELRNLVNDPQYAKVAELRKLLHGGWKEARPK